MKKLKIKVEKFKSGSRSYEFNKPVETEEEAELLAEEMNGSKNE